MDQNTNKSIAQQTAVVLLCAGKGTRMGRADMAKVCFEIDGIAAINRAIQAFKKLRFEKFVIVVGSMAEQVMATVSKEAPESIFVLQSPQQGTGDAAKKAAAVLERIGHTGPVLVSMGDKYIEPAAIESLVDGFVRQQADFTLATIPKTSATEGSGGRVFISSSGQVLGIIEKADISRAAIVEDLSKLLARRASLSGQQLLQIAKKYIENPKKLAIAMPEIVALASSNRVSRTQLDPILKSEKYKLTIGDKTVSASKAELQCKGVNPSLYMFNSQAFYQGVAMIDNDNAQKEYYITDIVAHLKNVRGQDGQPRYRVRAVILDNPDFVQGFNSPGELLTIQDYVRRKKGQAAAVINEKPQLSPKQYYTVCQWIEKLESPSPAVNKWFNEIYGKHPDLHQQKRKIMVKVLRCYGKRFGIEEKVVIVRAPGRINLMGRHVDHRGGYTNFLAIHRETIAVAGLRDDDNVSAINVEPEKFKSQQFSISELIGRFAWSDWVNFVNSDWVRSLLNASVGDWVNYIKAAMLRLQHKYQDLKIRGINIAITGDVPMAAGLSSSSTLVVATLQAAIALNNLELTSRQFIDLCGEGEWFVGSRGGAGDHAAIYLGQRGKIAQVGYLPFRVENVMDAPADYQLVMANSHIKAAKSAAAKHMFNSRITAYNLGLALLKQRCPEYAASLEYVRDLDPAKLGCKTSDIYRMLMKIPEFMTRRDFVSSLSNEYKSLVDTNFASHDEPRFYYVRGCLLFGAAEIMRARLCSDYLIHGDIRALGAMMKISHDGDRVARPSGSGSYKKIEPDCSDKYFGQLINNIQCEIPDTVLKAQLYMQPSGYACSTPEIDSMVDIACSVPGVAGAQLAGAGLGGCIMVLAKKNAVDNVKNALVENYYKPNNLEPAILNCITVEGAGLAEF